MQPRAQTDDAKRLSDLIGAIYDCAIDPGRWETTLLDIRDFLQCHNAALYLLDPAIQTARLSVVVGIEPPWRDTMLDYVDCVTEFYDYVGDFDTRPLDNAFVLRREIPDEVLQANRYVVEWGRPQGIEDSISVTLLREPTRASLFSLGRHKSAGYIADREVQLIELLAPHLRRAVAISDLIDMKTIEANALSDTLDALAAGIILVGEGGVILHTNRAARRLFGNGAPLKAVGGKLRATDQAIDDRLAKAIAAAAADRSEAGASGLGIALTRDPAPIWIAHVLPVSGGDVRARLVPNGVAAVFISSAEDKSWVNLEAAAEAYDLTPAETRMLGRIMCGESIAEASVALGVAQTTAKTHLARIMAKTGTHRQSALVELVSRLAPALQSGR